MKIISLYNQLKKKAVKFLSEGKLEEYFQTIIMIEKLDTKINKLIILN